MPKKIPDTLNPEQRQAVTCTRGPLLILAGAGTGKTRVITERIAYLLRQGIAPEKILAVTFTNKAAGEMRSRLRLAMGRKAKLSDLVMGTFHSLGVRILRRDATTLGYQKSFSIADQGEQISLIRKALRSVRGGGVVKPDDAHYEIGRLKNRGTSPADYAREAIDEDELTLAAVYRRYQEALKRINAVDFDDLILKPLEILTTQPAPRAHWEECFEYILVDEFQDTNHTQYQLIEILARGHGNLCVVGDDDQSIYGWRGAVADNILNFHKKFKNTTIIRLEQNYRSTNNILNAANAVIQNNTDRSDKKLWSQLGNGEDIRLWIAEDQQQESERVVTEIKHRLMEKHNRPADFAVILRTNAQTRPFEDELRMAQIPYVIIGGSSFFDHKEVRDLMGFLSVISNPADDAALLRIMNTPARGIGGKTVAHLTAHTERESISLSQAMTQAGDILALTAKARDACRSFGASIARWRKQAQAGELDNLVNTVITDSQYEEEIKHLYDDPLEVATRLNLARDVGESLRFYLGRENTTGLSGFLQEAALLSKADQTEKEKERALDAVKLITAHSAKGLEFPVVYVVGLEEGLMPHKNSEEANTIDEERRLFYVAMTRAERELTLTYCAGRILRGKSTKRTPSRFLSEIPEELITCRDRITDDAGTKSTIEDMIANLGKKYD